MWTPDVPRKKEGAFCGGGAGKKNRGLWYLNEMSVRNKDVGPLQQKRKRDIEVPPAGDDALGHKHQGPMVSKTMCSTACVEKQCWGNSLFQDLPRK